MHRKQIDYSTNYPEVYAAAEFARITDNTPEENRWRKAHDAYMGIGGFILHMTTFLARKTIEDKQLYLARFDAFLAQRGVHGFSEFTPSLLTDSSF